MKDILLTQLVNRVFRKEMPECGQVHPLQAYFGVNFIELRLNDILNIAFISFDYLAALMEEKTSRVAWLMFLQRTIFCYIQCMLSSSSKIKSKSSSLAIQKIIEDRALTIKRFKETMTARQLNLGVEVIEDLVSFFECSPDFISVPCEKLRKT